VDIMLPLLNDGRRPRQGPVTIAMVKHLETNEESEVLDQNADYSEL